MSDASAALPRDIRTPGKIGLALFGLVPAAQLCLVACGALSSTGELVIDVKSRDGHPVARAEVFVNGQKRCDVAPCLATELPPGTVMIKVLGAFVPADQTALIEAGKRVSVMVVVDPDSPAAEPPRTTAPTSAAAASASAAAASASAAAASASAAAASASAAAARSPCPPDMAFLPAGTFRMGSEATDKEADIDERPARDVTLSAFCLDITEVTVAQYGQCTKEERNGVKCAPAPADVRWKDADVKLWSQFCNGDRADRADHPINCVDWAAASAYCKWKGGALPTEAQWEYAARGNARKYPWGSEAPGPALLNACGVECPAMGRRLGLIWPAMYDAADGAESTAPVKSYPKGATPEGVFDLAGNVWEWVQDAKANYDSALTKDPVQTHGTGRVLRGGAWLNDDRRSVRTAYRNVNDATDRGGGVGFRCARHPDP